MLIKFRFHTDLCFQRNAYQCFKSARYQTSTDVSCKRARFQSASCQYMKLAGQSNPVRKTKSADHIMVNHSHTEHCKIIKKIPTVSISIASDSDNGMDDDSS
ncbi:hypothetical protein V9T40_008409 [Parthenolecanium corni]|uniref:Uncharacterized protein n=1 Tax=Parthenolecanium corni TaxID=536013 RepID=A0AAN9TZW4_9HEMI